MTEMPDLDSRVFNEIEFLHIKYNVRIHNLLAYMNRLKGQNEETLWSLKEAEGLIQEEYSNHWMEKAGYLGVTTVFP